MIQDVRDETDPVRRIQLAGDLMTRFQQSEVELSRIRRQALEEAAESGMTYSEVARQVGLTRGRVSQIRTSGPKIEREFYGIGPIVLGVPLRDVGRSQPVVASEDLAARDALEQILTGLSFVIEHSDLSPSDEWQPPVGDLMAICGPKSSPTSKRLLDSDPALKFYEDDGRWLMEDRATGQRYESPMDDDDPGSADVGYLGRLTFDDNRTALLIAGVHAIGSLGVVHYLTTHTGWVHGHVGRSNFSMVIRSEHDGGEITSSEAACHPILH